MSGLYRVSMRAVAVGLVGLGALLVPYFAGRALIRKHKPGRIAAVTHCRDLVPTSLDMSDKSNVMVDIVRSPTAGAIQHQSLTSP